MAKKGKMGLLSKIFSNTRKPEGFWGRMMVAGMNGGSHAAMASWGLSFVNIPEVGEIIDIGCGGGGNLNRLMERSLHANVTGIDYSSVSVEKSRKVNADAIAAGRCKVLEASVANLPFEEDTFGMATAFETVYFWPEIEKSFAEVMRVLSPGGKFLIVNEDDGLSGNNEKWENMIEGMHTYTPDELKTHLTAVGFRDITVHCNASKHWLCVTAVK
ncbi:MAG: methyltransferase domain-containing protein [Bacteroidales bacterium]|nr:methyltransferase domain-containing protein [Bacteroidales bacterium]